jgi:hypothetical protein
VTGRRTLFAPAQLCRMFLGVAARALPACFQVCQIDVCTQGTDVHQALKQATVDGARKLSASLLQRSTAQQVPGTKQGRSGNGSTAGCGSCKQPPAPVRCCTHERTAPAAALRQRCSAAAPAAQRQAGACSGAPSEAPAAGRRPSRRGRSPCLQTATPRPSANRQPRWLQAAREGEGCKLLSGSATGL